MRLAVRGFTKHLVSRTSHQQYKTMNSSRLKFFCRIFFIFAPRKLSRSVIGNTSDSGSEEFRFET